jgi:hypothetical protein
MEARRSPGSGRTATASTNNSSGTSPTSTWVVVLNIMGRLRSGQIESRVLAAGDSEGALAAHRAEEVHSHPKRHQGSNQHQDSGKHGSVLSVTSLLASSRSMAIAGGVPIGRCACDTLRKMFADCALENMKTGSGVLGGVLSAIRLTTQATPSRDRTAQDAADDRAFQPLAAIGGQETSAAQRTSRRATGLRATQNQTSSPGHRATGTR